MGPCQSLHIFVGWDDREPVAAEVCAHSILKRTAANVKITLLKHRELRKQGIFSRPWLVGQEMVDLIDNCPFSTQFSHTRFLVPHLMNHKGWALFMDSDMIFLSDIHKLFDLCDDKYAAMCVKHQHKPEPESTKMDGRVQQRYHRKNWSSFVLFNCGHPANAFLTSDRVNLMAGGDLHAFSWLKDYEIGDIPYSYNYIAGVSPKRGGRDGMPDVIHYTEGGPWFPECQDVPYGGTWVEEYEDWQKNGYGGVCDVPTIKYEDAR